MCDVFQQETFWWRVVLVSFFLVMCLFKAPGPDWNHIDGWVVKACKARGDRGLDTDDVRDNADDKERNERKYSEG